MDDDPTKSSKPRRAEPQEEVNNPEHDVSASRRQRDDAVADDGSSKQRPLPSPSSSSTNGQKQKNSSETTSTNRVVDDDDDPPRSISQGDQLQRPRSSSSQQATGEGAVAAAAGPVAKNPFDTPTESTIADDNDENDDIQSSATKNGALKSDGLLARSQRASSSFTPIITPVNPFDSPSIKMKDEGIQQLSPQEAINNNTPAKTNTADGNINVLGTDRLSIGDGQTMTSSFTPISIAAMNPFESPPMIIDDTTQTSPLQEGNGSKTSEGADKQATAGNLPGKNKTFFTTPIADKSADMYLAGANNDPAGNEEVSSEPRRRLEAIFCYESEDDPLQFADTTMQQKQQQSYPQEQGMEQAMNACQEDNLQKVTKDNKGIHENGEERITTSTQGESVVLWDENDDIERSTSSNHNHHQSDTSDQSYHSSHPFLDNRCSLCLLRILHRVCNPHIHPPCIGNPNLHPHLPKCLERISPRHRQIICRVLIIVFMIITITFTLLDLLILHRHLHLWLDSTLAWLTDHPVGGGLAFIGVFLIGSLCFFPVALLTLGAGYVYIELYGLGLGILAAFFVCYFGCLIGAAVCFFRSRYLMRRLVVRFSVKYPIVRAVDRAFQTMGFRLFLLLRLSPSMPFNALNYIGGITAITFRDYWWSTCAGIAPNLLWTIFVGATFGTVNARGVDGNKEFDQNSLRKGLVLGLGIGLGVAGIIGTGIYARRELTKIVIAEQRERAMEELGTIEMSQQLIDNSEGCEVIPEERDEEDGSCSLSLSFEDLEDPQPRDDGDVESDFSFFDVVDTSSHYPGDEDIVMSSTMRSDSSSPPSRRTTSGHRKHMRSWTPEAVAAELPILPKMLRRCLSPMVVQSLDLSTGNHSNMSAEKMGSSSSSAVVTSVPGSNKRENHILSASMPPMHITDKIGFSFESEDSSRNEDIVNASKSNSPPHSPTRRHTLQHNSPDNIKVALLSAPSAPLVRSPTADRQKNRPRASSNPLDDYFMNGLVYIDETKVLSDDESSSIGHDNGIQMKTPTGTTTLGNRRRCETDPTDKGKHGSHASSSISSMSIIDEHKAKRDGDGDLVAPLSRERKHRRQQSPMWTPTKQGLRKRHSFGSFGALWQTQQQKQPSQVPSSSSSGELSRSGQLSMDVAPSPLMNDSANTDHSATKSGLLSPFQKRPHSPQITQNDRARSGSWSLFQQPQQQPQQKQGNRPRASSLPFALSPSGNHMELSIGMNQNDSGSADDDGPSREWFWIWA